MEPQIISSYDPGLHNADLSKTVSRLDKGAAYKNLSCIIVVPTFASVPTRPMFSWWNMYTPPNQKVIKIGAVGMEVGDAYSKTIAAILAHPDLMTWRYMLCLEHDNVVPPDGLVKLLERAEAHPEMAAIGGLYFTKGEGGVAQIWGNPNEHPLNFKPQPPDLTGGLKECNGTGMGFTLFRLDMFKDERLRRPWFKTTADTQNGCFTQDLYFWSDAKKYGYRCAIDCSVRVGHYDVQSDIVW